MNLLFEWALLPGGLERDVLLEVDADGGIAHVAAGDTPDGVARIPGLALPGMPNLHSHAFQRAMAGAAETAGRGENSFWSWRESMYRFLDRLEPTDVVAISAYLYLEMLEAGYTSVAEFHYLHHQVDGTPYPEFAALARAVREGAARAGVRHLLLPTLYQTSGFGAAPPTAAQRRFIMASERFLDLHAVLRGMETATQKTGLALHSLRAVPLPALREVVAAVTASAPRAPIHIHVAEQRREVEECLAHHRRRPVELLLDTGLIDARWCLVHATHVTAGELASMARAQAVVGFCPTTEANLGDGRFPLDELLLAGGRFGIGSDSQVSIDPREELRGAEYTLRLWRERRAVAAIGDEHCGTALYQHAARGGAQALGLIGGLRVGAPADVVVLRTDHPAWAGLTPQAWLDAYVFAPRPGMVRDVLVHGTWRIRDGIHPQRPTLAADYRRAMARLTAA